MFIRKTRRGQDVLYKMINSSGEEVNLLARKIGPANTQVFMDELSDLQNFRGEYQKYVEILFPHKTVLKKEGEYLAGDNQTWFNTKTLGFNDAPFGQIIAYNENDSVLEQLFYEKSDKFLSERTNFVVMFSDKQKDPLIYEALFETFVSDVLSGYKEREQDKKGENNVIFSFGKNDKCSKSFLDSVEKDQQRFGCEKVQYLGQSEEDFDEAEYRIVFEEQENNLTPKKEEKVFGE